MDWLALSALSYLLFAFNNVNVRGFTNKWVQSGKNYFILFGIIWFFFLSSFLLVFKIPIPSIQLMGILALNGILTGLSLYFLFVGVSKDDAYRVAVLLNLSPVFTAILSFTFLNEAFSALKITGISLLIGAGFLASLSKDALGKWKFSPALVYALLSAFFMALSNVIFKYATYSLNPQSALFWGRIFLLLVVVAILLKPKTRKDFSAMIHKIPTRIFAAILGNEFTALVGSLAIIYAFALSTATLVSALGAIYPLFVLMFEVIYHFIAPGFVRSDLRPHTLLVKVSSLILMIPGMVLVA